MKESTGNHYEKTYSHVRFDHRYHQMGKQIKSLAISGMALTLLCTTSCQSQQSATREGRGQNIPSVKTVKKVDALDHSAWNSAKWISAANAPVITGKIDDNTNGRAADGASWFVSTVKNRAKVVEAKWMTTALGIYELYVNGTPVGKEVLKPGFTNVLKTRRSFTYDVTPLFLSRKNEENQLAVQVTPGWWADKIVTPYGNEGMMGKKCAFRGVLRLTFADGSSQFIGTDLEHWKAGIAGPVIHASIFDGEEYDARKMLGFLTAELLATPEENTEFSGEILPSDGGEVYFREDLTLRPTQAYTWRDIRGASSEEYGRVVKVKEYAPNEEMVLHRGETLVVDFGQNAAAVPDFTFKAKEGTVLTCLPGELLNDGNGAKNRGMDGPEGSVHRTNLRIADTGIRLTYTFAGGEEAQTFRPHCTFFGYRYLSITATDEVHITSLRSIPVSSIAKELETGTIETGNDMVNKLISNTMWGQRSNYLSVPTDCPQRNERLGWTADTQVFSETGTFFANTDKFFHKWMRDMRDSQNEHGGFPGVAPLGQYGNEHMRLGWADAGIIVPWTIWKQFGDNDIVEENWASMNRFMNHINENHYDHQALSSENGNYQWADWLSYEPLESCSGRAFDQGPKPEAIAYWNYLGANYWAIDADMMADMARATGKDATPYEQMAKTARTYMRQHFLKEDGSFVVDILNSMQTPALFALKNQLVDGDARAKMIARLRENFVEHGNCLQTGFLGTSILMSTLTENDMSDIAYELLFQRKNPSWLYSIDNGATTIWERWNSYMADKGMGPQGMNSFNHYAYGCVCEWIWETVAGISADPLQPGFKHIIMRPIPDRRLGYLNAEYPSASGIIKSAWRYEGDLWIWDFTIPSGTTASITLPGSTTAKEYGSGSHQVSVKIGR